MKSRHAGNVVAILALAVLVVAPVQAGPAGDALTRCIDAALTKTDKNLLARWMFSALSAYPDAQKLAPNAGAPMDSLNKSVADLFKKLIAQNCGEKTTVAMGSEGKGAVEEAFKLFPQIGVRELITDPAVSRQLAGLQKYMEQK